jgi:hypothetical protein
MAGENARAVSVTWDAASAADWDALLVRAGRSALQQGWAYGAAVSRRGRTVHRAVWRADGRVLALAQIIERRFLGLATVAAVLRGPVWLDADPADKAAVLRGLLARWPRRRYRFLLLQPDAEAAPELAALRLRRVMTGYSTSWLDLRPEQDALRRALDGKWRNQLRRAEEAKLAIDQAHGGKHLAWLLAKEGAQARARGYLGLDAALIQDIVAASGRDAVLSLTAKLGPEPIAGVLFLRHGAAATYQTGWSGEAGRERHAHNLLLWRGVLELKRHGVAWLDLGGIETTHSEGIAHFKLGLGGGVTTLAGTFL